MVRAATTGAIDFTQADPFDAWWWRRLHWTLEEIEQQHRRHILGAQHMHWVTLLSSGNLKQEGMETAWKNALSMLNRLTGSHFPWFQDQLEADGRSGNETLLEEYRAEFGYPGEPRYEAMVAKLLAQMKAHGSKIQPQLG